MAAMSELIEWHRTDEVLPDSDMTVLIVQLYDPEPWPGYLDGETWKTAEGFERADVVFWAAMPSGPML
jgi:hypothetical protein